MRALLRIVGIFALLALAGTLAACTDFSYDQRAQQPLSGSAVAQLKHIGSSRGAPMLVRIFKQESELEVWKQSDSGDYKLFGTYKICAWSGDLGPKIKEGDRQSPEGFYTIDRGLMNPRSHYYLAFNTGFPNKFDRAWGRTGSNLMVHGNCSSRGCYAMTDDEIKQIYLLARDTLNGGNKSFALEIYPFRMTPENIAKHISNPNMPFWRELKTGYDIFAITHQPAKWDVCDKHYVFDASTPDGKPLDATAPCPSLTYDATLQAALQSKAQQDDAAVKVALANIADQKAQAQAQAAAKAKVQAAEAARGKALGNVLSGFWGLFGHGSDTQSSDTATAGSSS